MLLGEESRFIWLGAIFLCVGIFAVLLGRHEERDYENGLARRFDLREFMERLPKWPQPGALRVGGAISIIVGVALIALALYNYYH